MFVHKSTLNFTNVKEAVFKERFTYLLKYSSLIKKEGGFAILMLHYADFHLFDMVNVCVLLS